MTFDYQAENRRHLAEYERRQEAWRLERIERERLDLEKQNRWDAQRQAQGRSSVVGLVFLVGLIIGIAWLMWKGVAFVVRVVWSLMAGRKRSPRTPTDPLELERR
jgi:ferric-dicitrate binding protein FerR (iron transport regulator)